MTTEIRNILAFALLLLAQVLVLNHIHLFHIATPLLYVYFVLIFPRNYPRWAMLVWSFLLGLSVDIFSNTPGVAASTMTLMGFVQPYILAPFIPRDSIDDLCPSVRTLGFVSFFYYALIMVFLYCLLFFTIESFSFFHWELWLENIGGSTALTLLLLMVIETVRGK